MEETWASGALELLKHADSHIDSTTAFDFRIAFISIDNSVEILIRTFLQLPKKISRYKFTKKEIDELGNSFPKMVELVFLRAKEVLIGLEETDIEYYHRIRNKLYHEGTGLSVDVRHLKAYRQIAYVLLDNLFGIQLHLNENELPLAKLIYLYNEVEKHVQRVFSYPLICSAGTYKWEVAVTEGYLTYNDIELINELRMIRNVQVHTSHDDIELIRVEYGVKIAESLLSKFSH